jgi:serine phosphatase RsbU (regulator of sigma subunit)
LVPTVLPGVRAVHAVDAAGVHPLLLAIAEERYVPYDAVRRPREILTAVNRVLLRDLEKGRFVTAFFALLDPKQHTLTVANAGHTPMLVCRELGKQIVSIAPKGLILGVVPDAKFSQGLAEETVPLYPGDRFLIYSDGVSELMNPVSEEFGMDRLETWMRVNSHLWSEDALRSLTDALEHHRAGQQQSDDITILTGRLEP